jgi:hypothetical protein
MGHCLPATRDSLSVCDPCSAVMITDCLCLALNGPTGPLRPCPLMEVERKWCFGAVTSVSDPGCVKTP